MTTRTTQCGCGRLRVTVTGEPILVGRCHCDFCQKRTGSAFLVAAHFARDQHVEIVGDVKSYNGLEVDGAAAAGGVSVTYHFCSTCGSTVYSTGRFITIAVGNFVDPAFPAPTVEYFTTLRHHWVQPIPGAKQYAEVPPDA